MTDAPKISCKRSQMCIWLPLEHLDWEASCSSKRSSYLFRAKTSQSISVGVWLRIERKKVALHLCTMRRYAHICTTGQVQGMLQGMFIKSRPSITGSSVGTVSATLLRILHLASRFLAALLRRCPLCFLICLKLLRHLRAAYLHQSGPGQQ